MTCQYILIKITKIVLFLSKFLTLILMIQLTFLGTGTSQGVPVIGSNHPVCMSENPRDKRLRSSALIKWGQKNYIIDCGPDFRQQLINNPINNLDAILFTHSHADHTAGLDDIRPFFFRQGLINIYLTRDVYENLNKRFNYILNDNNKYPGAPSVNLNIIDHGIGFKLDENFIVPIKAEHNKITVTGYRFKNLAYMTDVKKLDFKSKEKLMGLDTLVLSCLRIEPHPSHLNLEEALDLIDELKPKKTYLMHISHLLGFHDEVSMRLPKDVFLAYDNLTIKS
tara:strand:+ start:3097 stop:3939 length:843 start_codon:yes stop_codon:yes gene_type:complete